MNLKDYPTPSGPLRESFERQRAAPGSLGLDARREALATLGRLLRDNADAFCAAIDRDFQGRARQETLLLELFPSYGAIKHARRHVKRWMRPQRRPTNFWFLPGRSRLVYQPLGVVGIVVPWNYPIYLAVGPIVAALARAIA